MTPIEFSNASLTPAVVDRWKRESFIAIKKIQDAGITPRPGDDRLYVLNDGRLCCVCDIAPGFSVTLHADRGEWALVTAN